MSDVKDWLVEVVSPTGMSGDSARVRARTAEAAIKRARAGWKGTVFYDGTLTAKEAPHV